MTNAIDTGFCSYRTSEEKNILILQQFLINLNKNMVSRTDLVYTTNSCTYSLCIFQITRQLTLKFGLTIQMLHENESF